MDRFGRSQADWAFAGLYVAQPRLWKRYFRRWRSGCGIVLSNGDALAIGPRADMRAFVWDERLGMRELESVLREEYGMSALHPWGLVRRMRFQRTDGLFSVTHVRTEKPMDKQAMCGLFTLTGQ